MKPIVPICLVALGLVNSTAALAGTSHQVKENGKRCFNGYAYTLEGGQYRYTEHHEQERVHGRITTWDITYVGRHGQTIATKHMNFTDNPTVPVYTLKIPRDGYMEGIRHKNGQWTMVRRESSDTKKQTKDFDIDPPMAADSGFNKLVQEHFKALMAGKTVPFEFVAAGRQSVLSLKAFKSGKAQFQGRNAVVFKAELNMFLINLFVSSLKLTYDPKTEQLLEYRGIGNIHNRQGEVYPVRVSYYDHMPAVAKQHGAPTPSCGSVDGH